MQVWSKVDFGTGTVTFLDDTRKEDMLQVEYPNSFLLDMGWYQDRYIISIIQNFDWTHPVQPVSYTHLDVYKRQLWRCPKSLCRRWEVPTAAGGNQCFDHMAVAMM